MKSSIFRVIVPCSPLNVHRRFGGTGRLHFQGRRISQEETNMKQVASRPLAYSSTLKMEATCSVGTSLNFDGLHNVISQKMELFITTTVRTSNHIKYFHASILLMGYSTKTRTTFPTAVTSVRSQIRSCGICGRQNGAGTDVLRVLRFPLPIFIPSAFYI
jgi:hypothetical protein